MNRELHRGFSSYLASHSLANKISLNNASCIFYSLVGPVTLGRGTTRSGNHPTRPLASVMRGCCSYLIFFIARIHHPVATTADAAGAGKGRQIFHAHGTIRLGRFASHLAQESERLAERMSVMTSLKNDPLCLTFGITSIGCKEVQSIAKDVTRVTPSYSWRR